MIAAPVLTVLDGGPEAEPSGTWKVDEVPPRVEGRRLTPRYWQALALVRPYGVVPECGHRHTNRWDAHRCGVRLWGAAGEVRD